MSTIAMEMTSVPKYEHGKVRTLVESSREMAAMKQELLESPPVVKHRLQQLLYSVGMLMKHRIYHYVCVIYGWDLHCEMGEGWVQQMGVDQLTRRRNQPFYKVLVMDGSNRYAAEDNLVRCPANEAAPITHWEVGKYFCKFTGQAYVPNFALSQQYPEDSVDSQPP